MLRLRRPEITKVSPTVTTDPVVENPSVSSLASRPTEAYLDQMETEWRGLPEAYRRELRQELRLHLESMVAAYVELGDTPEQAVTAALERFGDARTQGNSMRRELRAIALRKDRRAATVYAICLFGGMALLDVVTATVVMYVVNSQGISQALHPCWVAFCIGWLMLGSPFVAGWKTGRTTGQQALRATGVALLVTILGLFLAGGAVKFFLQAGGEYLVNDRNLPDRLCDSLLGCGAYHLIRGPIALLAIWAGRRLRRPIRQTRVG